jgi:hypothetical protein
MRGAFAFRPRAAGNSHWLPEIVSVAAFTRIRLTFQAELSLQKETLICTVNSPVASMNTDLMDSTASSGLRELGHCQQ